MNQHWVLYLGWDAQVYQELAQGHCHWLLILASHLISYLSCSIQETCCQTWEYISWSAFVLSVPVSWKNCKYLCALCPSFSNNKSLTGFKFCRIQAHISVTYVCKFSTMACNLRHFAQHTLSHTQFCHTYCPLRYLVVLTFIISFSGPLGQRAWLASAAAMAGVLWCRQLHCIAIFVLLLGHLSPDARLRSTWLFVASVWCKLHVVPRPLKLSHYL